MQSKVLCRITQFFIKISYYLIHIRTPKVLKGENSLTELGDIINKQGLNKPLIVTGNTIFNLGFYKPLVARLEKYGIPYAIFHDCFPDPSTENVMNGYEVYKSEKCDCIVAIGGGSPMDCAKIIGAKVARPNKDIRKFSGVLAINRKIPPLFAVPTTSGTGSECTMAAVITDEKDHKKIPIADPVLVPKIAVLDPKLTEGLPPFTTATTAMDALCHALEVYTNKTYCTKKEFRACEKAVKLIYENVYECYKDGHNMVARENLQIAAYEAGIGITRGAVGYVHAIGHAIGGIYGVSHGEAMAIILPKVMRKYGKSAEKQLSKLADICGIKGENEAEKSSKLIYWIEEVNAKMGLNNCFRQIRDEDIDLIVKRVIKEANPLYPCPQIWKSKDVRDIVIELQGK